MHNVGTPGYSRIPFNILPYQFYSRTVAVPSISAHGLPFAVCWSTRRNAATDVLWIKRTRYHTTNNKQQPSSYLVVNYCCTRYVHTRYPGNCCRSVQGTAVFLAGPVTSSRARAPTSQRHATRLAVSTASKPAVQSSASQQHHTRAPTRCSLCFVCFRVD